MSSRVNGQTKGLDTLQAGFVQRHRRVLNTVLLALAIFAVIEVLRITIAQQQQEFNARLLRRKLVYSVANGRPHTRATMWLNGRYTPLHTGVVAFHKLFDDKEIDLIASIARKTVHGIGIAQPFEGLSHEHERFLFH